MLQVLQTQSSLGEGQQGNLLKRRFFGQAPLFPPLQTQRLTPRCRILLRTVRSRRRRAGRGRGSSALPGRFLGARDRAWKWEGSGERRGEGARFAFYSSSPPLFPWFLRVEESGEYPGAPGLGCRTTQAGPAPLATRTHWCFCHTSTSPDPLGKGVLK